MRTLAFLAALTVAAWIFGTPHVRMEYQCLGWMGNCFSYARCDYFGLSGWRRWGGGDTCPLIRLFPWRPFE